MIFSKIDKEKLLRLMKELRREDECTKDNLNTGLKTDKVLL